MKVLHIVYDLIRGGTEGQCARTAMACRKLGHDHRVAVFSRSGYFLPQIEEACGPVYEIEIRRMLSLQTLREVLHLRDFMRTEKFDLIHTWDMDAGIFGALAAHLAGVPYITSRRNLAEVMPAYKKRLLKMADRGAAAVVVNARAVAGHFTARGLDASKVHLIPNMLDIEEFDRLAARDVSLPAGRIIGMVCRLEPEKCVRTLIEAAPHLLKEQPDLRFVVVGEGSERFRLQNLASAIGVAHAVHFLGERPDVPALVKRFQIGVLTPSKNEGLSNSILEYMAAGIPVVATDCGGNAELLAENRAGFVVPSGDSLALAAALKYILDNPGLAMEMGGCGRAKIEGDHNLKAIFRRYMDLYESFALIIKPL